MATVRIVPLEEGKQTHLRKAPGPRATRMRVFDEYVQALTDNPADAIVIEDIEESGQHFVLSLRGAFRRAGLHAAVRKLRGRNEVRAWLVAGDVAPRRQRGRPKRIVGREAVLV